MIGARAFVSRQRIVETSKTRRDADVIIWLERRDRIHGKTAKPHRADRTEILAEGGRPAVS
jgi:hypothetical protein